MIELSGKSSVLYVPGDDGGEFNCSDFDGKAGPDWIMDEYVYGDITHYPPGTDQFWIATAEVTTDNPPRAKDSEWFGPCTCSDIWTSADRNDDRVGDEIVWDSTVTYHIYTIVLHNNSLYFSNFDGLLGYTPGDPNDRNWNATCETPGLCDQIRDQDIDWWSSTIAGGPGYAKGDVVVSHGGGSFTPNVWVSNVDQNHALPTGSSTTWQTGWDLTIVDPGPGLGHWPGIGLDSNDNVHIAYYDNVNGNLNYSMYDGTDWTISVIDTSSGAYSALVVDSMDNIHVAYSDTKNHKLKYAYYDGVSWTITVVGDAIPDKGVIACLFAHCPTGAYDNSFSIAVDSNDNPHISYFNRNPGGVPANSAEILYSKFDGASWTTVSVDSTHVNRNGGFSDIAVDSIGGVHITWAGLNPTFNGWSVRYAHFDGTSWTKNVVDNTGYYSSIAVDSNDNPRIAYSKTHTGGDLMQARLVQNVWQSTTVALSNWPVQAMHTSIIIDDQDRSHIASTLFRKEAGYSKSDYGLYYSWDPTGLATMGYSPWVTELVDPHRRAKYTDLSLESNGFAHLAYYDFHSKNLKHASASLNQGSNWTKCNCSDLSSEPWDSGFASNWQTTGGYDALSVVLHNGLHWMSFSDNNGLEPGSPNSDWYLCTDDATPCEDVKKTGDMWNRYTSYTIDDVVEHPVNSGNYWISLQDDNLFEPSNSQIQWWRHCSCEELSLGLWADATDFEEYEVVEWNGAYWTALMDHTSSISNSPGLSSDTLYWKKCRADACTTSGWWDSGIAISGMYDTGVVVSHPEPDGWLWISLIDDNIDYPTNSDYWVRCNLMQIASDPQYREIADTGNTTGNTTGTQDPPPDKSLVSVGAVEVTGRDVVVAGATLGVCSVFWIIGRRVGG